LERLPEEQQCGLRVRGEIPALARFVVRIKNESVLVETLEQHNARRGGLIGAHRCECHGIGLGNAGFERLGEPLGELLEGRSGHAGFQKFEFAVFLAEVSDGHGSFSKVMTGWERIDGQALRSMLASANRRRSTISWIRSASAVSST